jgi:hypothetical protein
MSPTSGLPVEERTAETLRALQRDSRYAIRLIVGTTFAGKFCRSSGSHCGHELAAADAWLGMDNAVRRANAMMRFMFSLLRLAVTN